MRTKAFELEAGGYFESLGMLNQPGDGTTTVILCWWLWRAQRVESADSTKLLGHSVCCSSCGGLGVVGFAGACGVAQGPP